MAWGLSWGMSSKITMGKVGRNCLVYRSNALMHNYKGSK
jgi:hypothetical protein